MRLIQLILLLTILAAGVSANSSPYDYSVRWRLWPPIAKEAYIEGMVNGISKAYIEVWFRLDPSQRESDGIIQARKKLFIRYTRPQIIAVMTDLYGDPANAYISNDDMFFIARDKIEGEEIEESLRKARSLAIQVHELNQ